MKNRANPENCRMLNRKYLASTKGKIARKKASEKFNELNYIKRKAQGVLAYAVKMKRITKTACQYCGVLEVEGHHPDYGMPLDVIWLCNKHHRDCHKK